MLYLLEKKCNISLYWLLFNEGEMFYTETAQYRENTGLCPFNEELKGLSFQMENLPMVRHAVLSFFFEYKVKNQYLIDDSLHFSNEQEEKFA